MKNQLESKMIQLKQKDDIIQQLEESKLRQLEHYENQKQKVIKSHNDLRKERECFEDMRSEILNEMMKMMYKMGKMEMKENEEVRKSYEKIKLVQQKMALETLTSALEEQNRQAEEIL